MVEERQLHGEGSDRKRKKGDMGRAEFLRQSTDKRERLEQLEENKRRRVEESGDVKTPIYATHFSQEDIENEQRRPKKKVAVLLGYSGTGYYGMQLSERFKTIEGELFPALVAAGAISKANAADPKKSSLVRCARTDKGVHAAGNIVSLKLMVDDPNIRVWNIQVTNKSFSCYLMCDSRVYEYLLPSHCLLPPHPKTYIGRKIIEFAEKEGDMDNYKARQEEVATYWEDVNETYIKPILEQTPEDIREIVEKAFIHDHPNIPGDDDKPSGVAASGSQLWPSAVIHNHPRKEEILKAMKAVKAAYLEAKRTYRIPPSRLARLQSALDRYVGTKNFYNYTIQKKFGDPSAKRHIKSFKVNPTPVIINGTEWLSLKVHGQSFMMHQIRKMVSMAAQIVRCGCDPERINESFGPNRIGIPKAPGLGLLLERPVFDIFNKKVAKLGKDPIDFDRFENEINEFKQREIYSRIFEEEEKNHPFYTYFNHIDSYPQEAFLYVTSGGIPAARLDPPHEIRKEKLARQSEREALAAVEGESEDEDIPDNGEEGG
ncbi:tRNA pseudouridine synthase [Aspergillus sclerotialis]|uniref:tRNA pseudouridine synthase 1 n=1 Tax=Aspergillus sclerotialis TaxID=2070753 RepID=A0A3A2ZU78_9EURO|nr:tRNA pseudouridine synthase [Aspergillus sclerotialis]